MSKQLPPQSVICSCGDHLTLVAHQEEGWYDIVWEAKCLGCGISYWISLEQWADEGVGLDTPKEESE